MGLPPLFEGAPTTSLSARATYCPFTSPLFLGEGPEQARRVRDWRYEVGICGAGHLPHGCNSAGMGEEGSPFVPGRSLWPYCPPTPRRPAHPSLAPVAPQTQGLRALSLHP